MTRKCNMNCKFCARGNSQNLDINKSIIDKTLNEMKDTYIEVLRISGGEPLMVPELIIYLLNKIIELKIQVNNVVIFTNGLKTDLQLCQMIMDFLQYLKQIEPEIKESTKLLQQFSEYIYYKSSETRFNIIISDIGRNPLNKKHIDNNIKFFRDNILNDDFNIERQSASFRDFGSISIEGNAERNFRELLDDYVLIDDIRIIDNNYYFLFIYDDISIITKTLTVSANGNVFPGCIMSYDKVDNSPMFNIMDCTNDFFQRVNEFCWEHPVNLMISTLRSKYLAIEFCRKNSINIVTDYDKMDIIKVYKQNGIKHDLYRFCMTEYEYYNFKVLNYLSLKYEKIAREIHIKYPTIDFFTIEALSMLILAKKYLTKVYYDGYIQAFLGFFTDFDIDFVKSISVESCEEKIKQIKEQNKIK